MINTLSTKELILKFYSGYLYSTNITLNCANKEDEHDVLDFTITLTPDILYYIEQETYYAFGKEYIIKDFKLLLRSVFKLSIKDFEHQGIFIPNDSNSWGRLSDDRYFYNYDNFYKDYNSNYIGLGSISKVKNYSYINYGTLSIETIYLQNSLMSNGIFIPNAYSEELRKRRIHPYTLSSKTNCKPIKVNGSK